MSANTSISIYPADVVYDKRFHVVGRTYKIRLDAAAFYCPYIPLQMVRTSNTIPTITVFKTRYGNV